MAKRLTAETTRPRHHALTVAIALATGVGLGISAALAVRSIADLRGELARAVVARAIDDRAAAVSAAVRRAEVAEQDYLLTRRGSDFARFQSAAAAARADFAKLTATASEHAWLARRAGLLTMLVESELTSLWATAERAQGAPGRRPAFTSGEIALERGDRRELDTALAEIERQSLTRDQTHMAAYHQSRRTAAAALLIGTAFALALLATAASGAFAGRRRLLAVEQSLRAETGRLAAMVNHIRDGVAVFDREDRLVLWNNAFFPSTGLPLALGQAGTPFARFAAEAADWFPPLLDEPRPHGEPIVAEMQHQGRVLEVWRSTLPDGGQTLAVADISKRVETEQMARQAQRMDALGQLTGGIAHDMNNLLQVISANLEQITTRLPTDAALRMRLEAAMTGVARGANLTRHLLAFARRQPLATEVIEPGELVRGTADLLRRTLGETYEVRLALDERESLWAIRTDPQQLENAVLNLALNARDAMPGGGRLVIIVTNRVLDEEYASHHAEVTPGQYVMIAVADTGQGMSPEQIARAAEPFYTTKRGGRGTGLGLSMVYGLIRQSGGHFRIDSASGEGTTVRLYLPRTHAAASALPRHTAPPPAAAGELVLVVEDDHAVRTVAVSTLNDLGYRTLEAENADAALELLRAGARPDVLFTDMVMPGSAGVADLVHAARKTLPALAVLFTTGYTDNPQLSAEALGPAARVLAKPWTRATLAESIREAIRTSGAERVRLVPPQALKILLVDDEPMVRETTAELLAALGHIVEGAATAAEARATAAGAELIITDAGLPDADGVLLAAEFRRLHPELPIIIVSGREARAAGDPSLVWLEKPFDEARLRQAIAQARAAASAPAESNSRAAAGARRFLSA